MRGFVLAMLCIALTSCGSSRDDRNKKSYQVGDLQISWNMSYGELKPIRDAVDLAPDESIALFVALRSTRMTLSDGNTYVVVGGNCAVVGYSHPNFTKLHNECVSKNKRVSVRLSRDALIQASEQAVKAEGSCTWLGYDALLDRRVRAVKQLASQTDDRLIFAKLRCG